MLCLFVFFSFSLSLFLFLDTLPRYFPIVPGHLRKRTRNGPRTPTTQGKRPNTMHTPRFAVDFATSFAKSPETLRKMCGSEVAFCSCFPDSSWILPRHFRHTCQSKPRSRRAVCNSLFIFNKPCALLTISFLMEVRSKLPLVQKTSFRFPSSARPFASSVASSSSLVIPGDPRRRLWS